MVAVPKALPNMARPMARNVRTLSAFYCKEDGIPAPTGTVPTEAMRCNARMASVCCITRWKGNPRDQRATGHPALGANGIRAETPQTRNECLICLSIAMAASAYRPWVEILIEQRCTKQHQTCN